MLDLSKLSDLERKDEGQFKTCAWQLVPTSGKEKPGFLAHHSSIVHQEKMYLFGGSNLETENKHLWMLDLKSFEWRIVKPVVK